ncbi:MAG: hypothetical protein HY700_16810 [Gemmatimonadetes bacterium]|nr:hypothetical protein [Gemmatimonadota bacterium]
MTRQQFVQELRKRRDELNRLGALVDGARLCDQILAELELLWNAEDQAELSLDEASQATGYSPDHLRRMARLGRLTAFRRGRRLFFRAADLPRKPHRVDSTGDSSYDVDADARHLVTVWRRRKGATDGETVA